MIFRKRESELDREVRHHLETLAESYQKQGMSREEAQRQARLDFGSVELAKDNCRDERRAHWLASVGQDIRFGWRMLRQSPGFAIPAILTLALGIGATSSILSFADAILWRPLPVAEPAQLTELFWTSVKRPEGLIKSSSGSGFKDGAVGVNDYFSREGWTAMRERAAEKAEIAAHIYAHDVSVTNGRSVTVAKARGVSGNFFRMLRPPVAAGRLLGEEDDRAGSTPAVVMAHRFWERQFAGERWQPGRTVRINNVVFPIVGVLGPGFRGLTPGDDVELYTSIMQNPEMLIPASWMVSHHDLPTTWFLQLLARRAPGVTEESLKPILQDAFQASHRVKQKAAENEPRLRLSDASVGLGGLRRNFADPVRVLGLLVTLVLLAACANIANLLLARGAEREREAALRLSLGCDAGRLTRQFFTESLMLAAAGGLLGMFFAIGLGRVMMALLPPGIDGAGLAYELGGRTVAGTAVVTLLTALLFGLWPARRAARVDVAAASREGNGSAGTQSRARWRGARTLVMVQVGLGLLLVGAAVLFTARLKSLVQRDTGFERGHVMLFDLRPGESGYEKEKLALFYESLVRRLENVPGVTAAGLARTRPMRGGGYWDEVANVDRSKKAQSAVHHASGQFLQALGIRLRQGRWITPGEEAAGAKVAVISEDLAKELDLATPLGARVRMEGQAPIEVIGVAASAYYSDMHRLPNVTYLPFDRTARSATVVLRTSTPPTAVFSAVREAVRQLDRDLPLVDVYTMDQQINRTLQRERMFAWLCGSFGVLALVICAVGLYGLLSHMTARRTPEIGIRMTLGATRAIVMREVLSEGLRLALLGLALGVPLAWKAAEWAVEKKLWPEDVNVWSYLGGAAAVLATVAFAAAWLPAWRASALDPMRALRRG